MIAAVLPFLRQRRHSDLCLVVLARSSLDDANDKWVKSDPHRIVVEIEIGLLGAGRTAEGGRLHLGVEGGEAVVERIDVCKEVEKRTPENFEDLGVSVLMAPEKELLS